MNILGAGRTAAPHSRWHVRAYQEPMGHSRDRVRFLIVLSEACWWRGPRTCTPPPQNDYAANWMCKQAVWEESSRNMQHCCAAQKYHMQNMSCLFCSLNKCSGCMIFAWFKPFRSLPFVAHTGTRFCVILFLMIWISEISEKTLSLRFQIVLGEKTTDVFTGP